MYQLILDPVAVDCEWNEWNNPPCSQTCGGSRLKTRTKKVQETNGGPCKGSLKEIEACGEAECIGIFTSWYLNNSDMIKYSKSVIQILLK